VLQAQLNSFRGYRPLGFPIWSDAAGKVTSDRSRRINMFYIIGVVVVVIVIAGFLGLR
jgi:hypothetical protein